MEFEFSNKHLIDLYEKGKSNKYRLEKRIIKKFIKAVLSVEAALDIYDLWNSPALKFEKLEGFSNKYSIRLGQKYRLEMEIQWENEEKTVGFVSILNISLHYGD